MDKIKEIMLDINIQKYEHDYNFKKKTLWDITKEQTYEFVEYKRELRLKKKTQCNYSRKSKRKKCTAKHKTFKLPTERAKDLSMTHYSQDAKTMKLRKKNIRS